MQMWGGSGQCNYEFIVLSNHFQFQNMTSEMRDIRQKLQDDGLDPSCDDEEKIKHLWQLYVKSEVIYIQIFILQIFLAEILPNMSRETASIAIANYNCLVFLCFISLTIRLTDFKMPQ